MATTSLKDVNAENYLKINSDGSINTNGGGGGGGNASVGTTGATAPTSATELGAVDGDGNLRALLVDPDGKLVITGSSSVTGTVSANISGLTAFQTSQIEIDAVAINLTPTPLSSRSSIIVKVICTSNQIVYVGPTLGVTSSTGYPLFNGDTLQLDLDASQNLFAIGTADGQLACILELG